MDSIDVTGQTCGYHVKNTFLSTPTKSRKCAGKYATCPGNISPESTKDTLPTIEKIEAPELDDTASNASDATLSDDAYFASMDTHWQRMQTQEPLWPSPDWPSQDSPCGPVGNTGSSVVCAEPIVEPQHPEILQTHLAQMMPHNSESFATYAAQEQSAVPPIIRPAAYPVQPRVGDLGEFEGKTTIMLRNLPNKYTRALLLEELGRTGYHGTYDFLYLPLDATTQANKGYAFINFISPAYAATFKETYEDCMMPLFNSSKLIAVTLASLQGFSANYAHYANARCNKGDPAARPLFLRDSQECVQPWGRRRPIKLTQVQQVSRGNTTASRHSDVCTSCGAGGQMGHRFCSECGKSCGE